VGTRVLSKPKKNNNKFEEEKVIESAKRINMINVIKSRVFLVLFDWRWPTLVRRETGISQKLNIRRGVEM
jgi:hypothetical protein